MFHEQPPSLGGMADEDLLTLVEASAVLRCSVETLRRWHRNEYGPASFISGRRRFYRAGSLREWLAEQEGPK